MRLFLLVIVLCHLSGSYLHAQEINFGEYGSYTITLDIDLIELGFGEVVSGSGMYSIEISEALQVELTGVKYLDVFVEIIVENGGNLVLDAENSIPFNLKAAYSNVGSSSNSIGNSIAIPVVGNVANARFPVLKQSFQPPGPPPPPPTGAFNQSLVEEQAILYLYGSIDVGDVDAGNYTGEITINVSYE